MDSVSTTEVYFTTGVLKVWSGDPQGSLRGLQGVPQQHDVNQMDSYRSVTLRVTNGTKWNHLVMRLV